MAKHLLNRRQFSARCAALGLSLPAASALIAVQANAQGPDTGADPKPAPRTVTFPNGTTVPAVGQGSWHLGQGRRRVSIEEEAMRTGIALGMTVIDTSRNYGENGESEKFVGRVIKGQRDRVFLVSKVQADEIELGRFQQAIDGSLFRLGTDYLDLYLLHSPVPSRYLSGTVAKFEELRAAGKIRAWGVSNFNVEQMEELFRVPDGNRCATNQVRYSINNRFIERDVLPWCAQHKMPVMAASPLGGLGDARTCWLSARWCSSALSMVSRPPRLRWALSFAAGTLLQFPNPAIRSMSRKTPPRFPSGGSQLTPKVRM